MTDSFLTPRSRHDIIWLEPDTGLASKFVQFFCKEKSQTNFLTNPVYPNNNSNHYGFFPIINDALREVKGLSQALVRVRNEISTRQISFQKFLQWSTDRTPRPSTGVCVTGNKTGGVGLNFLMLWRPLGVTGKGLEPKVEGTERVFSRIKVAPKKVSRHGKTQLLVPADEGTRVPVIYILHDLMRVL